MYKKKFEIRPSNAGFCSIPVGGGSNIETNSNVQNSKFKMNCFALLEMTEERIFGFASELQQKLIGSLY